MIGKKKPMNIISLFSGAGGLDLGLIQAGNTVIWANDIDKLEKLISKKRMATKMANTKEAKDLAIRERHYLQIKLDYLKGKLSRFTMVEIPKGFSNRQGVDIGIIGKYTRLYLNTIFRNS